MTKELELQDTAAMASAIESVMDEQKIGLPVRVSALGTVLTSTIKRLMDGCGGKEASEHMAVKCSHAFIVMLLDSLDINFVDVQLLATIAATIRRAQEEKAENEPEGRPANVTLN